MKFLLRKAWSEIRTLGALAAYPFVRRKILTVLERGFSGINVETTNICNADCIFCAYQHQSRPEGIMSMDLYSKVLDDFARAGGGNLNFTPVVGDPLVDPHLVERIRMARALDCTRDIGMYSNMISLRRTGVDELLTSGVNQIVVSTSGFDQAMYERVYRSRRYQLMRDNVLRLLQRNHELGKPVEILLDLRVDRPQQEVIATEDYRLVEALAGAGNMFLKYRYDNWGGKIRQSDLSGVMRLRNMPMPRNLRISPCKELFNGPTVYWNGAVGACSCRDVNASELIIGNVHETALGDIWQGEELRSIREEFLGPAVRDICRVCSHYSNLSCYVLPEYRERELHRQADALEQDASDAADGWSGSRK